MAHLPVRAGRSQADLMAGDDGVCYWLGYTRLDEGPSMDTPAMKPATVLVVDDDALINIGTVDMVQDLGYRAVEAYSGSEALDILARNSEVGVIITDYAMPGMTGLELADRARALRPGLPVLLATGYGELPNGDVSDLPRLTKPFQQADLVTYLKSVLAGAGPGA